RVGLVDQPERLKVLLRRDVDRVRLAGCLVDALHHDTRVVPIDFASLQRVRAHTALIAIMFVLLKNLPPSWKSRRKLAWNRLYLKSLFHPPTQSGLMFPSTACGPRIGMPFCVRRLPDASRRNV